MNADKLTIHYCPFVVSFTKCSGTFNTIIDPLGRIYVLYEIDYANLRVLNMIKVINESKARANHVSFECK